MASATATVGALSYSTPTCAGVEAIRAKTLSWSTRRLTLQVARTRIPNSIPNPNLNPKPSPNPNPSLSLTILQCRSARSCAI